MQNVAKKEQQTMQHTDREQSEHSSFVALWIAAGQHDRRAKQQRKQRHEFALKSQPKQPPTGPLDHINLSTRRIKYQPNRPHHESDVDHQDAQQRKAPNAVWGGIPHMPAN